MSTSKSENGLPESSEGEVPYGGVRIPLDSPVVRGYDWSNGINYEKLLESYFTSGFQATNFGMAVKELNNMVGVLTENSRSERLN